MDVTVSDMLAIAQLGVIATGVVVGIAKLSRYAFQVGQVAANVESTLTRQNEILEEQREELKELRSDHRHQMDSLGNVLTTIAVQDNRIDRVESDVRDMKHGRGFVQEDDEPVPPNMRPRVRG